MKNVIKLAETECPQPPPISQQFCNVIDCPVQWNTGEWTKVGCIFMNLGQIRLGQIGYWIAPHG